MSNRNKFKVLHTDSMLWAEGVAMDKEGDLFYKMSGQWLNMDEVIICWSTGSEDMFDDLIFEGDIINDHNGRGVVEWWQDNCAFRVNYKDGTAKWFRDYLDDEKKTIVRIGNIYNNPEFMEKIK